MTQHLQFGARRPGLFRGPRVEIEFEGKRLPAFSGEPLAVSLLAAGVRVLSRSIKFHRPRSVFCMSGDCGACLLRVDGEPNQRACRVAVHEGLRCERQNAWPSASLDILEAADEMFPDGMDHHTLMTSPRPLNLAMQKVVQKLGGLGLLPDEGVRRDWAHSQSRHVSVVVIGGGPAGLAAATACKLAHGQGTVLLIEAAKEIGGSYLCDPRFGPPAAAAALTAAREAGVEVLTSTPVFSYYPEEHAPANPAGKRGMLAALLPQGLLTLSADRYIYATGGHEQNALFEDNDRPGVLAGRAVGQLRFYHGISVGERPLIVGNGEYAAALSEALKKDGAEVLRPRDGERIVRALGHSWVTGALLAAPDGAERQVECDLIAVVEPKAPAFELPHMHKAALRFDAGRGFVVIADAAGRTSTADVFACGELVGVASVKEAIESGHAVGAAAGTA